LTMITTGSIKLIYIPGVNKLRNFNSKARAYLEFIKAKNNVPAYRDFLKSKNFKRPSFSGFVPNIHEIPVIDKENYIKKNSLDSMCAGGMIPNKNIIIDESSGSTGKATSWVRGKVERKRNAKMIEFGLKNLVGKEPLFIINAFALGPWATGVNVTMSCVSFSKLKSLGPDKEKIVNTLMDFGSGQKYVIMGYPPFLKYLVDNGDINWKDYDITFIFGGESMSEGLRDHLLKKGIKKVFSSLGASDLELNMSAENDFTISLRKLLDSNEKLREKMLEHTGALPMIFQYNPADFLFESSDEGELLVTICRPGYVTPKVRYNLHDRGHTLSLKEVYKMLEEFGIDKNELEDTQTDLPLLLHYGRADMTVSFFGSNISPTDIQETIYSQENLKEEVNSYFLEVDEDAEGNKKLIVSLEVQENRDKGLLSVQKIKEVFFSTLAKINQDFREAMKMIPSKDQMIIKLESFGEGVFSENDIRIKAKYV
ncbi:MAG: phenylacetate-CoA ligase, partial [Arenicella sp.]